MGYGPNRRRRTIQWRLQPELARQHHGPFFFFQLFPPSAFNDNNNGHYNITLNSTVKPASVLVNNSAGNYVISGTGIIGGTGSLTKMGKVGNGRCLSTANTYTGMTTVSGGALIAASNSALGSSTAGYHGLAFVGVGTSRPCRFATASLRPSPR